MTRLTVAMWNENKNKQKSEILNLQKMDTCTIISLIAESSSDDDCIFEISDDEVLLESLIESVRGMFIIPAKDSKF